MYELLVPSKGNMIKFEFKWEGILTSVVFILDEKQLENMIVMKQKIIKFTEIEYNAFNGKFPFMLVVLAGQIWYFIVRKFLEFIIV